MCQIFINANPKLYASRSRSIRLHGVATSLRLENLFWNILEEIATRDGLSVPLLVSRLHDELLASGQLNEHTNFTSFLRVSCMRYQQLQLAGRIPTDPHQPLRDLDSRWVLAAEHRPSA
ncbi:ribbon-helix-helix domain-containing protein [Zoogloea sp.]|uniref:ribbon-helix-helix domain-containing protein n=1 Tax=Zoogloea sp. TaxID=49181 RepID=UPI002607F170|nr:ribbon-helix-helix domain-containing protein [Zoogloea sp.]MDD3352588.1 ribbon-helix-helix domain-containing protein [Zoogloea sp.]